jgi:hypothetical protein
MSEVYYKASLIIPGLAPAGQTSVVIGGEYCINMKYVVNPMGGEVYGFSACALLRCVGVS